MLRKVFNKNHLEKVHFSTKTLYKGQFNATYRGVPAWRCPFDYFIYQMIVNEVKPDLIIEIGTNYGGGALYLSDLLKLIGKGQVHSIDIVDKKDHPLFENIEGVKFFYDGWKGYDIESYIKEGMVVLIIDDGSHTYEDVLGSLNKFWKYVSLNSYFIVEDGIIDELVRKKVIPKSKHSGGPVRAVKEFLSQNDQFSIDQKWQNFFGTNATFNVCGYLKRMK